jgi:hypothetical protein
MKSTRNFALATVLLALAFTVSPRTAAAGGVCHGVHFKKAIITMQRTDRLSSESLRMVLANVLSLVVRPY